ncbi:MAG: outer membrane beta-barrel protein [Candidatus Kapabacteria bacterium]|nr:outer membrane beta-barrel protein [Candidatus Kapabacteria bacterium]
MTHLKNKFIIAALCVYFISYNLYSEDAPKLTFGGYIDSYIALDNAKASAISQNATHSYSRLFAVSDNRKSEIGLNIAQITANMDYKGTVRGKFTLQLGDLANNANPSYLSAFPNVSVNSWMTNVQEAFIGYRVIENLWVDAGFFLTHIGAESLCPKDNWLSSHSMVTYFEPIFQSGIRAQYDISKFTIGLHILNANGRFDENNDNKTIGFFLKYTPTETFYISNAACIGNEENGGSAFAKNHLLNNIVIEYHPTQEIGVKAQFDYGTKANMKFAKTDSTFTTKDGTFLGAVLQARYQIMKPLAATLRFSYFDNADGVEGFGGTDIAKGMEFTSGVEYKPFDKSYIRLEARMINMANGDQYKLFTGSDSKAKASRSEILLNMGFWID